MSRKRITEFAAYHGGSWKFRQASHQEECAQGKLWPFAGLNSEFSKLKEVLLYTPPARPAIIADPENVQHLRPVDWKKLGKEITELEKAFLKNGVRVRRLEADWFSQFRANLMFTRDHFFMTPWGAVLGRMASPVRAGEEKWAQKALSDAGIPLLHLVRGQGTFEGADALWLSPDSVLIGIGNRTNRAGFLQIKKLLAEFQIHVQAVRLPKNVQHLLGLLQIVDKRLGLVRTDIAGSKLLKVLRSHHFRLIEIPESPEVTEHQGMNIVTLAPRRVIMPAHCPSLKALYTKAGLRVAAEVPLDQALSAAGGIACATGILARVHCLESGSRVQIKAT